MIRSTYIVEGPLALHMQRLVAARENALGREILTLPLLAARLAGGFIAPAGMDMLYPAIQSALAAGGFRGISEVSLLPGMPRAVLRSLDAAWRADIDLSSLPQNIDRFADLHLIETRIRAALPPARLLPRDLRDRAMARVGFAKQLLGPVTLKGIPYVDPIWHPLLSALFRTADLKWDVPTHSVHGWYPDELDPPASIDPATISTELCADPKSEVVEALRWVRQLLSSGNVKAEQIAIAAASPKEWDDHFLAYSASAKLPLHFSHGVPALGTPDGQTCAALADMLTNGLSQERVWRLLRRLPPRPFRETLPSDWFVGLPRKAGLRTIDQWRQGLAVGRAQRAGGDLAERVLLPVLELLGSGPAASSQAGQLLFSGSVLRMWERALQCAPPHAIALSLTALRMSDDRDPGNSAVWCPASHLAISPRPYTRLLGLTSQSWPRSADDDPIIPNHLLDRRSLRPLSVAERDRLHYQVIRSGTREVLVLSRPQRNAKGSVLSPSSLWPGDGTIHKRDRIPEHAFSECDRLLARPRDAIRLPHVQQSRQCWRDWHWDQSLNAHDGLVAANHPAIEAALTGAQSTTRLQRLLRDPLGFVWRYALGWRRARLEPERLDIDAATFGELVHELISDAIARLEPTGLGRASNDEVEAAIQAASTTILSSWPLQRAVPPPILWRHIVAEAARRTAGGLAADDPVPADTQSWTEVPFGQASGSDNLPWDTSALIPIERTGLAYRGRIDRVDIAAAGDAAKITDYKSTKPPPRTQRIALGQGRELQRVLYAMAIRRLLPNVTSVEARLIYLADNPGIFVLRGDELDRAIADATTYLNAAVEIVRSGKVAPRWEDDPFYTDTQLALPTDREAYMGRKRDAFLKANQGLNRLWGSSS